MIFSLFGVQFHLLELLTLMVLSISFPGRLAFAGSKVTVIKKEFFNKYIIAFSLFLISIILSSTNALNQSLVLKAFIKWLEVLLLSLLIFFFTSDQKKFKKMYWLLLISCLGNVLIKYLEIMIGKYEILQYRILPGYDAVFSFVLLLPLINEKKKYIYVLISLSVLSLLLSLSRGAWMASLICVIYFLRKSKLKSKVVFLFILLSITIVIVYLYHMNPMIKVKLASTFMKTSASNLERFNMIIIAFKAFLQHPLLGIGALNFSTFIIYNEFTKLVHSQNIDTLTPHNFFLQVAAEEGLVGIIAFIILLYIVYRILFMNDSFKEWLNKPYYIEGLKLFFIAFFVSLILGYISGPFRYFFGVFCGLTLSLLRLSVPRMKVKQKIVTIKK